MGVDSRLFISHEWGVQDIMRIIEKQFGTPVRLRHPENIPDMVTLHFKSAMPGWDERMIYLHLDISRGGFKGKLLSLRANDEALNILSKIAKTTGGFLNEQDYDDDHKLIENHVSENTGFLLKECLIDGYNASDADVLAEYLRSKR